MKKILLLVCFPLLLPLAAQADVSVDINVPGVSLHLGSGPPRLLLGWLRLASPAMVACTPGPRFGGAQCARPVLGRRALAAFAAARL